MAAQSTPAVEDERTTFWAVQTHVVIEHVVAPEGLSQPIDIVAGEILLPVEPPEVDALALTIADDAFEHGAIESGIL